MAMLLPFGAFAAPAPPTITSPATGAVVNTGLVSVAGSAPGDAVAVRVFDGGAPAGDTSASGGAWSVSVSLGDGPHTLTAAARDASGAWSEPSGPVAITVDTAIPAAPVITAPFNGALLTFSTVTIEGTAEPAASVTVATSVGTIMSAVTGTDGRWRASRTLADTTWTVRATARDRAGNTSTPSAWVSFRVDTAAPPAPVVSTPANGGFVADYFVTIAGATEPGATISIAEGLEIASTVAAANGTWNVVVFMDEGQHRITARATDTAGHTSAARTVDFTVDLSPPDAPEIDSPTPDAVVSPSLVVVAGRAEPYATVDVIRGGIIVALTNASATGAWSVKLDALEGPVEVRARARDRAGNIGEISEARAFNVDGTPPSVAFTTPDGKLFGPSDAMRIEGHATDDFGTSWITLDFYDVSGRAVATTRAQCAACNTRTPQATWVSNFQPLPGRYVVKAFAFDLVGNKSVEATRAIIVARV